MWYASYPDVPDAEVRELLARTWSHNGPLTSRRPEVR
jgi:hypothetical protein